jgi:hypothetical protein
MSGETRVSKIVVAIGRSSGPEYPADGQAVERHVIEAGGTIFDVPPQAHLTWLAAFTDPDAHGAHAFTRDRLAEIAGGSGVADAAALVDKLIRSNLLAEYEPGTESALDFLRSYKLYPMADGLGNSPEDPSMFGIGRGGTALLSLEHDIYAFWSGSYREATMWDAVVKFDKERPDDAPFTAEDLGHLFAGSVPVIVATRVGFLDPR